MNFDKDQLEELLKEANHVEHYRDAGGASQVKLDPETVQDLIKDIQSLTDKCKRYEEALEFYANPDTYGQDDVSRTTGNKQFDIVCFDSDRNFKKGIDMSGKRAREALSQK